MTYKEKFEEYKKGNLSPAEAAEIENDIEKFSVLMDYFDEKIISEPIPVLTSVKNDDFSVSEQIDKLINKRIKKSTARILIVGVLFIAFFVFGLGGTEILQIIGFSYGAAHFAQGIFSAVYYAVNAWLLYRSFVNKSLKPAVFIIIWNIVLIVLTFAFSAVMGDAVPFVLPIILGFSTLPQYFADIFDSIIIENIMNIFGTAIIPLSILLSVIAIIFIKKQINIKPISKKLIKIITAVFFSVAVILSGVSTIINYLNGAFPYDFLGSLIAEDASYEINDDFIKANPLDKSDDKLKAILEKFEYEYFPESDVYRKGRSDNMTVSIYFGENNTPQTRSIYLNTSYYCITPHIPLDKMERISSGEYFKTGDDESYVMKELCGFGLTPCSVNYLEDNGERFTSCRVMVRVHESESYPDGYDDVLELEFKDGKLVSFDSFHINDSDTY